MSNCGYLPDGVCHEDLEADLLDFLEPARPIGRCCLCLEIDELVDGCCGQCARFADEPDEIAILESRLEGI